MPTSLGSNIWPLSVQIGSVLFKVTLSEKLYSSEKDFYFLPHNHSCYEIQYFSEGSCMIHTHTGSYLAKEGDICIAHPYEYHTFLRPENAKAHMSVCSMYLAIEKETLPESEQAFDMHKIVTLLDCIHKIHDDSGKVTVLFRQIQSEFDEKKTGYLIAIRGLATTLLTKVFQLLLPSVNTILDDNVNTYDATRMLTIERFFLFNYSRDVSINDLANQLYVCPRRVNQIINKMFGCSFTKKLINTRLEVAKYLLFHSKNNISEICTLSGFNSQNYFYTTFRKITGLSPQEYRKLLKSNHNET